MLKYLERWFPALTIRRAARYSSQLEEETGFSIHVVDSDGTLCFFLIDPYGDPQEPDPNSLDADFVFCGFDANSGWGLLGLLVLM